ncbi:MAG: carboxypeptidase regulatory-like domain-containing protein [Bryobacteraceae bacterium]
MNKKTILAALVGLAVAAATQTALAFQSQVPRSAGTVQGTVKDDTGGVIPGAVITLTNSSGNAKTTKTAGDGTYTFRGVAPGSYTLFASYPGLQQTTALSATVTAGKLATGNIAMTIQTQKQEVTVTETTNNQVGTDPSNNASALVLRQEDLDALPDDPDDLQADLQALAGPSAGPGGSQIFIDGFTGGRLPPKETIREIRINSNPFSAEFDKLGYGRIQIFTKPGTDKFHGQGYYNISDDVWNSRNPFLSVNPPFRTQLFGGNFSGPLGQHASLFIDAERRNIDDNGIINATIAAPDFLSFLPAQTFYPTPQRRTTVSPRIDYQLNANNTLSFRYAYRDNSRPLTGVGSFNLPGNGYSLSDIEQTVQVVETSVLGPHAVNETHFQYERDDQSQKSQSTTPQLNVANSFVSGGSGYSSPTFGSTWDSTNDYEFQNYTTLIYGAHSIKAGLRIRAGTIDDYSPKNFNGVYSFLGTSTMTSIQQYLTTEQLLNTGYSSAQVTAMGYGPSKFTMSSGHPYVGVSQLDFGPFVQDDWRVRPNFTLSLGARWEAQTNISDKNDWAPRIAFAWSPDSKGANGRSKTVIRGGWGMFYDRFDSTNVLTAYRYNGLNQINYLLENPTVYDSAFSTTPPLSNLQISNTAQRYQIDSHLHAPYLMQTVLGVERQVFSHTTLTVNFMNARGVHELRTVNINAPLPTPANPFPGTSNPGTTSASNGVGIRPYGNVGDIYLYESSGIFKQTQVMAILNSSVGRWLTLFGRYVYGEAHSDTDGLGTLPANQYDFSQDYGRSKLDVRNQIFAGGSIAARWGLRFSPFVVAHSGTPYNITTGTDLFQTGQSQPTARPSVASGPGPNIIDTPYGFLNTLPLPGQPLIERNIGQGPGFIGINLRVSKTWGFGTTKFKGPSGGASSRGGYGGGGGRGGGFGGGGFGGGGHFGGSDATTEHRYNVTLSVNARNILNHENLNTPNGALTSPYVFQSTGITGGYGAEATASNQRRIDLQLRFTF